MGTGVRGRDRAGVGPRSCPSLHRAPGGDRFAPHQAAHSPRGDRREPGGRAEMRIEVFIDDESAPRYRLEPPAPLELDTEGLADGPHRLRVHAIEDSGPIGVEEIPFTVRNGPGIAVVGLSDGDTVRGRIPLLVNAFASRPGGAFEPGRAETPAPIPTWAWVLFLVVVAWGMWYVPTELRAYQQSLMAATPAVSQAPSAPGAPGMASQPSWAVLGEQ